jgi:hypothetical protein
MDIGFNYEMREVSKDKKLSQKTASNSYNWKFGFALLDLGKIKFRENTSVIRLEQRNDPFNINSEILVDLMGQIANSKPENFQESFDMILPGAVSAQLDKNLGKSFFLNILVVRRIKAIKPSVLRSNIFAITPRFETKWLGFSMPLILFNDRDPRVGLSLRVGYVTIGSDNITSIIL